MKKSKTMLAGTMVAGAIVMQGAISNGQTETPISSLSSEAIRPFHVHVLEKELSDLRHRILATRWPDKETVNDQSQGIKLDQLKSLVHYWGTGYNWRKVEKRLNALPQFVTTIDGVDIHFIHVRSKEPNALPIIISHGWPGSIIEQLKIIEPLTNPVAFGGKAEDAFDVVIPSLPGWFFGFNRPGGPATKTWDVLMKRHGLRNTLLKVETGCNHCCAMGRQAPSGLIGIHINNLAAAVPTDVLKSLGTGAPAPATLSERERLAYDRLIEYRKRNAAAYFVMMTGQPQTVGYGITDSPTGLAAWLLGHPGFYDWSYGNNSNESPTKDDVLDDITLYWLTNSAASSGRIYWENAGLAPTVPAAQKTSEIKIPVAVSVFMEDSYVPAETWARQAFSNLVYFHDVDKGGHFAAWEQPSFCRRTPRTRSLR
jgi:pimeloyl-ACP methyl ester carboxylesterase